MVMRRRPVGRERPGERLATRRRAWRRVASRGGVLACVVAGVGLAVGAVPAWGAWGFEQVTPGGKGGGAVQSTDVFQVAPDGESLLYSTTAPFASVPSEGAPAYTAYLARRGPSSWDSVPLDPPQAIGAGVGTSIFYIHGVFGTSRNLRYAVIASTEALAPGAIAGGANIYRLDTLTGERVLVAAAADKFLSLLNLNSAQAGVSNKFVADDGMTLVFAGSSDFLPGTPSVGDVLYVWTEDGGLKLASVLPAADGGGAVYAARSGNDANQNGVRDSIPRRQDGPVRLAFSTPGNNGPAYLRDGNQTRVISVRRLTGSPEISVGADVQAVSDNGRFVLFSTIIINARLTDDTPVGFNRVLYLYDADSGSDDLVYIGAFGGASDRVLQMSHNGRSVAFQSTRALVPGAVAGRRNMYVWRDGTIKLVSVPDAGSAADSAVGYHYLMSEGGRYLVFTDDSASVAAGFGFDNSSTGCATGGASTGRCLEVYRFDADAPASDGLACASCRTDGERPLGASGDPASAVGGAQRLNAHQQQTIAEDGTVFFTSADDLLAADSNGEHDAYAWRDGELRLLSRARPGMRSRFVDASTDGRTVLIATYDPIAATDTDRSVDLYVTREGAGFPDEATDPPAAPCTGSDCRSAPVDTSPVTLATGSSHLLGGAHPTAKVTASKITVKSLRLRQGTLRLAVVASGRGLVRISGRGLRSVRREVSRAGRYRLTVKLTKSTKRRVARTHKFAARVRVTLAPPFGRTAKKIYRRNLRG